MRNLKIAVAVTAALAAGSASAYDPTTGTAPFVASVVAGSSALRNGFANEMKNTFCAGAADYSTFISSSSDFRAYSCTLTSTASVPTTLRNQTAIVYYRSEGGSFVGVGPLALSQQVKRLKIDSNCVKATTNTVAPFAYTCPVSGYVYASDTGTGNLVNDTVELGISDEEPAALVGENLPDLTNSPFDTSALDVSTITPNQVLAQGFAVAVNTSGDAGVAAVTNLSSASINAILQGTYSNWNQVPKADNSGFVTANNVPITVCRRDVGSGTQTMASIFFYGVTCNSSAGAFGAPNNVVNNSTGALVTCLQNHNNSIGYLAWNNTLTNAQYISIDGVAPTLQGFAAGTYKFGSTAYFNNPGAYTVSANDALLFGAIIKTASTPSKLPAIGGTAGLGNNLTGLIGVNGQVKANAVPFASATPVASWNNGGNSCSPIVAQ
ncbi:MAG TPA: substrate-binding domain-containing protein [Steroidobacteraceae bacterium]|nr:substrate-binding domain-containing protein [Steroidobacteraceae bacterium]